MSLTSAEGIVRLSRSTADLALLQTSAAGPAELLAARVGARTAFLARTCGGELHGGL